MPKKTRAESVRKSLLLLPTILEQEGEIDISDDTLDDCIQYLHNTVEGDGILLTSRYILSHYKRSFPLPEIDAEEKDAIHSMAHPHKIIIDNLFIRLFEQIVPTLDLAPPQSHESLKTLIQDKVADIIIDLNANLILKKVRRLIKTKLIDHCTFSDAEYSEYGNDVDFLNTYDIFGAVKMTFEHACKLAVQYTSHFVEYVAMYRDSLKKDALRRLIIVNLYNISRGPKLHIRCRLFCCGNKLIKSNFIETIGLLNEKPLSLLTLEELKKFNHVVIKNKHNAQEILRLPKYQNILAELISNNLEGDHNINRDNDKSFSKM